MTAPFSILDIGRRINHLSVACYELDETPLPEDRLLRDRRDTKLQIMLDEQISLHDLALALRPQTLPEAAVQLAILLCEMEYKMDTDDVRALQAGAAKIQRASVGVIRAVAAAAGVDVSLYAPYDLNELMDAHYPEPEPAEVLVIDHEEPYQMVNISAG